MLPGSYNDCSLNLSVDSVLIRYLRLGIDDGHLLLMASQDDATAQSVSSLLYFDAHVTF